MFCKRVLNIPKMVIHNNVRMLYVSHGTARFAVQNNTSVYRSEINYDNNLNIIRRFKHDRKKSRKADIDSDDNDDSDDDDDESYNEDIDDTSQKVITKRVQSVRLETVIKAALGMSRRKVEEAFYKGHIRINGERILKKSTQLNVNDEIDYIIARSTQNPDFLTVHRMVLLSVKLFKDAIQIKVSREKSLLIEDYNDPWKGGQ